MVIRLDVTERLTMAVTLRVLEIRIRNAEENPLTAFTQVSHNFKSSIGFNTEHHFCYPLLSISLTENHKSCFEFQFKFVEKQKARDVISCKFFEDRHHKYCKNSVKIQCKLQ